jgi:endonuclease/exonuclease/phosphatase family metal-dependent hydrolase
MICAVLLLLSEGVRADPETPTVASDEIAAVSVLTWNVFMMPTWTRESPSNRERAHAIAVELLKFDYDILVLEKVFDRGAREVLDVELKDRYPYRFGPVNGSGCSLKLNGGVYVLSRVELSGYQEIQFRDSADVEVFSRKGAMLLSGQAKGRRFQLIATHLQGDEGSSARFQRVRRFQLDQIAAELISPYGDPTVPLIIAGDFVTPRWPNGDPTAETPAYRLMLAMLSADNGSARRVTLDDDLAHNDLAADNTGRTAELDYVLVRKNGHAVEGVWERLILRRPWGHPPQHQDLSYRYAVGVHFRWK